MRRLANVVVTVGLVLGGVAATSAFGLGDPKAQSQPSAQSSGGEFDAFLERVDAAELSS